MLKAPDIRTPLPGPHARAVIARDAASLSPAYPRALPFVMARGEGAVVEDVDGNRFIDCASGIATTSTGHAHPDVVEAIVSQARRFLHMSSTVFYGDVQVRLAEELSAVAPFTGPARCFLGNSGAEAVEASVKMARHATKRQYVIAFLGAFHGRTVGAVSLTASKAVQRRGASPLMPGVLHAPYAYCYRCPLRLRPDACEAECAGAIEDEIFVHLVSPDEVAAIIVEPILGEGGYVVPPPKFLRRVREIATRHQIVLIADEVQSGMGRTGRMFAIEHAGVEPDIVALAKGIASGMPLGVSMARAELMPSEPGAHGSTFGGNPVSCAAALATIRLLRESLMANAATVGAHLLHGLASLAEHHAVIGEVRGAGLMIGIELVRNRDTRERAVAERDRLVREAFDRGLLLLGAGPSSIRLAPPLVLSLDQAGAVLDILDQCLAAIAS